MEMTQELDTSKGILDSYHLWLNDAEQVVEDQWEEVSARVMEQLSKTTVLSQGLKC